MIEEINIENLIYEVREKQVMLDSDVARLYGYDTKRINEIVKRNINRFPEGFCFKVSIKEWNYICNLRSQIATSSYNHGGRRVTPYVFTEHGIMMLAGILKSDIAVNVSKKIIYAFISMRKFINENKDIFKRITIVEYDVMECKDKISELFDKFETKKIENEKIFFNGEIYDAYSLIIDLIRESVEKFNKQYPNLTIKYSNIFHDRFIIIDNNLYHVGASFKDLGKKCFGINKIEDNEYLNKILDKIN